MDAARALADLAELSTEIEAAVLLDASGTVAGATPGSEERAQAFGETAKRLLEKAEHVSTRGSPVKELQVATREGSVFVVREEPWTIAATTTPKPVVGLILYDLRTCLRSLAQEPTEAATASKEKPTAPKARRATKKDGEAPKARGTRQTRKAAGGDDAA